MPPQHDPNASLRSTLRVAGPIMILVGAVLFLSAMRSMIAFEPTPFGGPATPPGFFLAFLGVPLIGLGAMATKYGFLGPAARYAAHEISPAATVLARATAEGVRDGLRAPHAWKDCPRCHKDNDDTSAYCNACGAKL